MADIQGRHKMIMKFSKAENPHNYWVFNGHLVRIHSGFRVLHLRPLGQLSVYVIPHFFQKLLERTDGKNNKIFNFQTGETPEFTGFLSGANCQPFKKFRVSPVITTLIPLHALHAEISIP